MQVATLTPVITPSTTSVAANATSLTISGFGFSTTLANNVVTLSGAWGSVRATVTAATVTKLTLANPGGLVAGALSASVTSNGISNGRRCKSRR